MGYSGQWALDLWDAGYQVVVAPLKGKRPTIAWKKYQTERVPREQVDLRLLLGRERQPDD